MKRGIWDPVLNSMRCLSIHCLNIVTNQKSWPSFYHQYWQYFNRTKKYFDYSICCLTPELKYQVFFQKYKYKYQVLVTKYKYKYQVLVTKYKYKYQVFLWILVLLLFTRKSTESTSTNTFVLALVCVRRKKWKYVNSMFSIVKWS
jgi:hypothetical protein